MSFMKTPPTLLDVSDRDRPGPGRWGWLAAAIWLFYLSQPFEAILHHQGMTRVVGLIVLFLFALSYVGFFGWIRWVGVGAGGVPTWKRLVYLAGMLTLCLLMLPSAGQKALTCLVYIAAITMMAVDVRLAVVIVALLLGGAELSMRLVPGWGDDGSYGFCEETGEPIGIPRLLARPTATLSLEAQERRERVQKLYGD